MHTLYVCDSIAAHKCPWSVTRATNAPTSHMTTRWYSFFFPVQECSFCISFRHAGTQGRYDCYFVVCNVAVDICTDEDDFEVGTEIAFGATRSSKVGAVWDYEGRIAST